jgi:thiamine-monophosphate kinase
MAPSLDTKVSKAPAVEPASNQPASNLNEFDMIARYFAPLAGPEGLGLLDDAACFTAPKSCDLVISKDILVADTHFFADGDASDIAFKALSVNVSDLAAKGAVPLHYLLGLSLPKAIDADWLKGFAKGLSEAQATYGITLVGGDTTATQGPVTISITAIGSVNAGCMIKRSGARAGDDVYVSGTLGDAALGLQACNGVIPAATAFQARFDRPLARHTLGQSLVGIATAAADVSDGLLADLGHICKASGVGARVYEADLPVSDAGRLALANTPALKPQIWSGGDDYEILFTAPKEKATEIRQAAQKSGDTVHKIGQITAKKTVELVDPYGKLVQVDTKGYRHF